MGIWAGRIYRPDCERVELKEIERHGSIITYARLDGSNLEPGLYCGFEYDANGLIALWKVKDSTVTIL